MLEIWTDGSCRMLENATPGGWGWVDSFGIERSGGTESTTNNRMELTAVVEALRHHESENNLTVFSDSAYIVDCMRFGQWRHWKQNGWLVKGNRRPVANQDLWEQLLDLYYWRDIEFVWVKAHSGNRGNMIANRLAQKASKEMLKKILQ